MASFIVSNHVEIAMFESSQGISTGPEFKVMIGLLLVSYKSSVTPFFKLRGLLPKMQKG